MEQAVAPYPEITMIIKGQKVRALLDMGSQVTLMNESYYLQNIQHLLPTVDKDHLNAHKLFNLKGVKDGCVPLTKYFSVDIQLRGRLIHDTGILIKKDNIPLTDSKGRSTQAPAQLAMSQGENQSLHDQLAHWDQVRQAGITLSQKITSLTTNYEPGTASSEIFRALLPDCFRRIRARTEATFHELHATLPTLLCQFVAPDQAGQMLSAIFTCMCNYNTEICGMAMAQVVVPVYTIPNTYWVQQSLWEGICRIIPSIAHTSGSDLCSFEPAAPHNTPVEQVITVPVAGNTGVSSSTHKKNAAKGARQTGVPLGIPPARSVWVAKEVFQHIPTANLMDDGDPPGTRPQKTSTPIKTTPEANRSHSGKKLNISKIKGAHLLFEMQDKHEKAQGRESEAKGQAVTSHQVARGELGSGGELLPRLPAKLPKLPDGDGTLTKPSNPALEASNQGKKCPLDVDDEVVELDQDEATGPPKKKKKKKNKSKDRSKDKTPMPEAQDDGARANTPMAKPEVAAKEPVPVSATSRTLAKGTKVPKKKKKKSAEHERF